MGMSVGNGNDDRPQPVVNVTPLVDIALVVLIIFMVVTPMMLKTFWLNLPQEKEEEKAATPKASDAKPLVMTIDHDGTIRVNKTVLSMDELDTRLPRMLAAAKQRVIYFDAHDDVPYGRAVEVMDRARGGGARTIALLTENVAR